jgi:hypothetical protein
MADEDPLLDQRRQRAIGYVRGWLRRQDDVSVLSITSYGAGGGGLPDRAYDAVAAEGDLWRAVAALEPLRQRACRLSRAAVRERGWFAAVELALRKSGLAWVLWIEEVEARSVQARPFETLLDEAATAMVDGLGAGWF